MAALPFECQRYYAISKKIPKDVKRYCGMCRQHGVVVETRGHNCAFKNCDCSRCLLIRQRRKIMRTQIRLRRAQDKRFQRTLEPKEADLIPQNQPQTLSNDDLFVSDDKDSRNMCYFCQKCKNHGILMWKKDHKRYCRFTNCDCEQCVLIETRRKLDQYLKRSRCESASGVSRGVIEYASRIDSYSENGEASCSEQVNGAVAQPYNCGVRSASIPASLHAVIGAKSPQSHSANTFAPFPSQPKVPSAFAGFPQNLNPLVMLQMTSPPSMFQTSPSLQSRAPNIFPGQQYINNPQLPASDFPDQLAKDFSVYASFLNTAQDYLLRENLNSVVF